MPLSKPPRALRIIALPLTRSNHAPKASRSILTYYQFQLKEGSKLAFAEDQAKKSGKVKQYLKWGQQKATNMWAGWGEKEEGTWQRKTYDYGEKLVDRIDFEELALKSVDPSLGPSITHPNTSGSSLEKDAATSTSTISLLYPPSIDSAPSSTNPSIYSPLNNLRDILHHRTPRHRKGFLTWMIIAPFTAPFMIVPVIPNLPFFFCVWRSWSHWRAYRASEYLQKLLDSGIIVPVASKELDAVYRRSVSALTQPKLEEPPTSQDSPSSKSSQLLLTKDAVPEIVSAFELSSTAAHDVRRAIEQARIRLERGKA